MRTSAGSDDGADNIGSSKLPLAATRERGSVITAALASVRKRKTGKRSWWVDGISPIKCADFFQLNWR